MNLKIIRSILEAIAVGDATGMPVEFMTRQEIREKFGQVDRLLSPEVSLHHSNLRFAQVTDDTEQNLYLIKEYCTRGYIGIKETALCLLQWAKETGAIEKKYIGPSSLKALKWIEEGGDPYKAGLNGTTCGGIMRTPSAVLCGCGKDREFLAKSVLNCCIPTHNTSTALEAAMAYAFAMQEALDGAKPESVVNAALEGAEMGIKFAPYRMCAASSAHRIRYLHKILPAINTADELLDFIYNIFGVGLESEDICPAVLGIFMYAKEDVWLAIRLGASAGGDTDTVAALAGALCAAYANGHNIPHDILDHVKSENRLDFTALSNDIAKHRMRICIDE